MAHDTMPTVNPATGERSEHHRVHGEAEVDAVVAATVEAQAQWRRATVATRAKPLLALAAALRDDAQDLAALMAREMGKPVTGGLAEVEKCAWLCEHYAEHGADYLAPDAVGTDARRSYVLPTPLGIVLAVMPWNYPLWQALRAAVPALVAGNGVVLKHASNVPGCAVEIERLFARAGFPTGLMATVLIPGDRVAAMIERPEIAAVTLTGSEPAGRAVAAVAGRALKKCVLELGGSDPYVVLEDADLDHAAAVCVAARLTNSGQSCIAAKRFIAVAPIAGAFTERVVERMRAARVGDPADPQTEVGPMARVDLRDELHDQVRRTVEAGGRLRCGGEVPERDGAWYPPTVVSGVTPGMPMADEECFGPAAAVLSAADEAEAIALANATAFGLGAAVFTRDVGRGERIAAQQLDAGLTFVNAGVKSDPRLPFGGIKASGYGRELGALGIREFTNLKTVWVDG